MTSDVEFPIPQLAAELGCPKWIRGVLVRGMGGGFGDSIGSSRGLSNAEDLQWLLLNRSLAKCILVSSGTALRENYPPVWRAVGEFKALRDRLQLPVEIPVVVVSEDPNRQVELRNRGFRVTTRSDLADFLMENHWDSVVCEGGPQLIGYLISSNQITDFALTDSPLPAIPDSGLGELTSWLEKARRKILWQSQGFKFQLLTSSDSDNAQHG